MFDVVIQEIQTILIDVELIIKVKVIKIAFHLKLFFLHNPDIELLIALEEIKGFGRVFEFILLGLDFNAAHLKAVIEPLDIEGNTELTITLENAISNSTCEANVILQIQLLIKFFKRICLKLDNDYPSKRKHAYITIILNSFLSNNASSCLIQAILNAHIKGFGKIKEYLVFCDLVSYKNWGLDVRKNRILANNYLEKKVKVSNHIIFNSKRLHLYNVYRNYSFLY